jgi:hypothetical protein
MKFKKIVAFGDSWIWGDELLDPALADHPYAHPVLHLNTAYRESHCFLGQLGQHYNLPTENFGIAGGSLQSTIWTYLWWIKNEPLPIDQCMILVGLTDPNRMSFYDPNHVSYSNDPPWQKFVHSAWVWSGATCYNDQWMSAVKNLFVLTDCPAQNQLNYEQTVWFFEGQSAIHTNNLIQFNTLSQIMQVPAKTLIWPEQSLDTLIRDQPDFADLLAASRHPNEKGHCYLANRLISKIDSCIINA